MVTPTPVVPLPPTDPNNPAARLGMVALAGSQSYAKEYRLKLLHRMLMRNVPLDQIAAQLKVSISTVQKDRAELKKRLREVATELDINEIVGSNLAEYEEITGMAMRIASSSAGRGTDEEGNPIVGVPTPMKLAAMRTALAAKADKTRFLASAGVFDVLKFRRSEDGTAMTDVQMLMQQTKQMMEAMLAEPADDDTPRPRAGGFQPMTFDADDATSSLNEIEEI